VIATTPTTIQGVSVLSGQKKRSHDVFELVLSRQGIEVHRPERPVQQMSWDRVSEWEIEERNGYVLLTLRGNGATTPLAVPGWTLDDLEVLMRDVTAGGSAHAPSGPERVVAAEDDGKASAGVAVAAPSAPATSAPTTAAPVPAAPVPTPAPAPAPAPDPVAAPDAPAAAAPTRAERRQRPVRGAWRRRLSWRVVVTIVLLGVLATAVILVLLQSAGIIDWSFLGPVA
jgi:hypothetical protein